MSIVLGYLVRPDSRVEELQCCLQCERRLFWKCLQLGNLNLMIHVGRNLRYYHQLLREEKRKLKSM
jgi:hypothetical protein